MRLIRRESDAVGVRSFVSGLSQGGRQRRCGHRDGLDDRVRRGVDHVNGVRLVFGDIQQRLGRVQRGLVRLACDFDPLRYPRRAAQIHHVDLAVANAGHVRYGARSVSFDGHPERVLAAGNARLRVSRGLAWAQIEIGVGHRPVAVTAGEHRDRVVIVVRHHQGLSVSRDGQAGGARIHAHLAVDRKGAVRLQVEAEPQPVAHGQRHGQLLRPDAAAQRDRVNVVILAAGNIEMGARRIEDDAVVGIRDLHRLLEHRRLVGNVVDEDVLVRVRRIPRIGRGRDAERIEAVEPAGENQQGLAIRTYRRGHRLRDQPVRVVGKMRVQIYKLAQWRNLLGHVGYLLGGLETELRLGRRAGDEQCQDNAGCCKRKATVSSLCHYVRLLWGSIRQVGGQRVNRVVRHTHEILEGAVEGGIPAAATWHEYRCDGRRRGERQRSAIAQLVHGLSDVRRADDVLPGPL